VAGLSLRGEKMSFGKMNTIIEIKDGVLVKDSEGFSNKEESLILRTRGYKEERHGSRKWANMAAFTKANASFQIRKIPNVMIVPGMMIYCDDGAYKILSVEGISHLYLELAAEKIEKAKA
jgi:hypothetical protein